MLDIAICLPYWEHWECLQKTLKSYHLNGYFRADNPKVGLSICDDGSIEEPIDCFMIEKILGIIPLNITHLKKKDTCEGPGLPRNEAVRAMGARYAYVGECDTPHYKPYLFAMYQVLEDELGVDAVFAPMVEQRWWTWRNHNKYRPLDYDNNMLIRREEFDYLGGYDNRYREAGWGYEDTDLAMRMKEAGCVIKWIPDTEGYGIHLAHPKRGSGHEPANEVFRERWGFSGEDYYKGIKEKYGPPRPVDQKKRPPKEWLSTIL
jgi:hypothetical protein